MSALPNVVAVARREFLVRVRTRSFQLGTIALAIGVLALAFVPVIIRYFDRESNQELAVVVEAPDLATDPAVTIGALLNATVTMPTPGGSPEYVVTRATDLGAARADVRAGELTAALGIERLASGELSFTIYTNDARSVGSGRLAALVQQAATAVAIADRLDRLGIEPANQGALFAPAPFAVRAADPTRDDPGGDADAGAAYMLGFGMTILIFVMIVLYGQWVAMSVVEEKSSRVMEVILNAATPFQLLSGKVLGVGAVALAQYAVVLAAGGVALLAQGPVAQLVLGEAGGGVSLPEGLTMTTLLLLGLYGVLGFLLYAVLYAAAGSLVSRMEDVQQAVMPMAMISTIGYLVAVYSATGLLDIRAGWVVVISQIPFFSPFMMLSRVTAGEAAIWEVPLSVVLLVVAIVGALWLAARIYSAGVLMYGQRPGLGAIWRVIRTGM